MRIGFIGLGKMGEGMAGRLLAAGHSLTVYNRTAAKAAKLKDNGAVVADTPAAAATGAEAVITMLADDAALARVPRNAHLITLQCPSRAYLLRAGRVGQGQCRGFCPSTVRDAFVSALARGYENRGMSVLGRIAAENAGLR